MNRLIFITLHKAKKHKTQGLPWINRVSVGSGDEGDKTVAGSQHPPKSKQMSASDDP